MNRDKWLEKCESPIEIRLAKAMLSRWPLRCRLGYGLCSPEAMRAAENDRVTLLYAQYPIGRFRVDFLVVRPHSVPVVVECDGHAYHQGDPSTWERDAERDKIIQQQGFVTLRFPGSRIHRDSDEVVDIIEKALAGRLPA